MATGLSCGIVGLPNVGKSTLFNALTRNCAPAANYPFCTIDPNVGIVPVADERLAILSKISKSGRIIPAAMQFVDIAGLVAGASSGEGLGNKFLANIRETSAIAQVVRCFDDDDVIHVAGKVNPLHDIEVINLELILADLQMTENILSRLQKQIKGKKELQCDIDCMTKIQNHLNQNQPIRSPAFTTEEQAVLKQYNFLTAKPILYIANVSEKDLPSMHNTYVAQVEQYAKANGGHVIPLCAKLEEELSQLPEEESIELLHAMGLSDSGLNRLIKAAFHLLGLITYLTSGEMETRAWTILQGTNAQEAAGVIHTDIQKGFIRAEVISCEDIVQYNGRQGAKEAGKVRFEGKEYLVQDGDVILFLHH